MAVDEFTAIAERWGYWSDGTGELLPSVRSALDASSRPTLPRALHRLLFSIATPVVRVLELHPPALARAIDARFALRDNPLQAEIADGREEGAPVLKRLAGRPGRAIEP